MSACSASPERWFSEDAAEIAAAKDGCGDCRYSKFMACRKEGFSHEFGVFGGLSPKERQTLDPKGYAALINKDVSESEATDRKILAKGRLAQIAPGLDGEKLREASAILSAATSNESAGVALVAIGMTGPEVGTLFNVDRRTVRRWGATARKRAESTVA